MLLQTTPTCNPVQTFRNFVWLPTRLPLNEHHNICVHICKNDTLFAWGMVMLSVFHYIQWLVSNNTLTATHSCDHHCWACRYTAKCVIAMNLKKLREEAAADWQPYKNTHDCKLIVKTPQKMNSLGVRHWKKDVKSSLQCHLLLQVYFNEASFDFNRERT